VAICSIKSALPAEFPDFVVPTEDAVEENTEENTEENAPAEESK